MIKYKNRGFWIVLFLIPTFIMFFLIYLGPLMLSLYSSLTNWNGMGRMDFIGLENYKRLFRDKDFVVALKHTLVWLLLGLVFHVPLGTFVALVLKRNRPGWKVVRATYMFPGIISKAALATMFLFIYRVEGGLLNDFLTLIGREEQTTNWLVNSATAFGSVTNIWLWYAGLITLIVYAELSSLSPEIEESALLDGAKPYQIDFHINLPLVKKTIGSGCILTMTAVFHEFETIYLTTKGGPGNSTLTLPVMMVDKMLGNQYGYVNTIGNILMVFGIVAVGVCNWAFKMDQSEY